MIKNTFLVVLGLLLFLSCQNQRGMRRISDEGLMYAMIYDFDNTPVSAVTVYLNGRRVVESDIQGRFILDNMRIGEYNIRLVKRDYETIEERFYYDPLNVLYFKMINTQQLVTLAETAIDNREFTAAEHLLKRALVITPDRPDILFLKSIVLFRQQRNNEAIIILENLIRTGNNEPAISQFLEMLKRL
jgi:tetratricopeptide (TPR) repeat protein